MTEKKEGALGRKPGKGRPKAKNPLTYVVNIRLTATDGRRLDNLAEALNRDRADLARSILLAGVERLELDTLISH
ncbi:MAG: hypothetical protein LBP33_01905 [Candidatus Adiutrix sp.]|jgi:predicted DNA-binding protein|nr:hypothetical protein [Candidatus Adiutrix sp.]